MISVNDRITGMFLGQAVGDALGLSGEFLSKRYIREHYGKIENIGNYIQDAHRSLWRVGEWTDDTDHFLILAQSIVSNRSICAHSIADGLYKWAKNGGRGIGQHTMTLFLQKDFLIDPLLASKRVWELSGRTSAPNGAIMRTGVLGALPADNVAEVADYVARTTHHDPRCRYSSALITLLIQNEIYNHASASDVIDVFVNCLPGEIKDEFRVHVEAAVKGSLSDLNLDGSKFPDSPAIGYTLKTMSAAIWCLFNASSLEEGLIEVVNEGGDADTNGAVAGALLGAKFGSLAIPTKWESALLNKDKLLMTAKALQALDLGAITFSEQNYKEKCEHLSEQTNHVPMPVYETREAREDGPKLKIKVASLSRISNICLSESDMVISISSPGNIPFVEFPCDHLSLTFSDISTLRPYIASIEVILYWLSSQKILGVIAEWYWVAMESVKQKSVPFRQSHARRIKQFFQRCIDKPGVLYIHCDFGKSRSAAAAEYLHRRYGVGVEFMEPDIKPNTLVQKVLDS